MNPSITPAFLSAEMGWRYGTKSEPERSTRSAHRIRHEVRAIMRHACGHPDERAGLAPRLTAWVRSHRLGA